MAFFESMANAEGVPGPDGKLAGPDAAGGDGAAWVSMITSQLRRLLRPPAAGEVINWEVAADTARETSIAKGSDPAISAAEVEKVEAAFALSDLFLDQVTDFVRPPGAIQALSAADWITNTMPRWRVLTSPMAKAMTDAIGELLEEHLANHPGAAAFGLSMPGSETPDVTLPAALFGQLGSGGTPAIFKSLAAGVFGIQLGRSVGMLSREVFGYTDIGLPLGEGSAVGLLPGAVNRFAKGCSLPAEEVRLFLATRESAHARLFAGAPWLVDRLTAALEAFSAGVEINLQQIEDSASRIDFGAPGELAGALRSGVFTPEVTPRQKAALEGLETDLALIEGWVEHTTTEALQRNLPDIAQLSEMMRRRRAEGGPAEHALITLVGLEMRPRRARQATELWRAVAEQAGSAARDGLWAHPDLLPVAADLDEPATFWDRRAAQAQADATLDAEIAALLDGDLADAAPPDPNDPPPAATPAGQEHQAEPEVGAAEPEAPHDPSEDPGASAN
jgi:putative hydrolase